MSAPKFTPGPWVKDGGSVVRKGRGVIASIPRPQDGGVFECEANSVLLAASPDLYDALDVAEAVMSIVEPRSDKAEYLRALAQARAALAKARGDGG